MFKIIFLVAILLIFKFEIGESFLFPQPHHKPTENQDSLENIILKLADKVNSYQVLTPKNYSPPFSWSERLGLFRSDIRLNFFGNPIFSDLRNGEPTAIFDNDMFSTGWIVTVLLEAGLYGKGAPVFDPNRLQLALDAIGEYNNKNDRNAASSVLRTFWPQVFNDTTNVWYQQPINIRNVALNIDKIPWGEIEKVLEALKLDNLAKYIDAFKQLDRAIDAFCIPPDFDDTYLNFGLGATLSKLSSQYPNVYESWLKNNTDVEHLVNATIKYSYYPFDSDINRNVIDPRTFFFARNFIQEAQREQKPLALITTWIQNLDEQREFKSEHISMPFNLNNVDVTVAVNSIYGITSGSLYDINDFSSLFLNSNQLQQIYLNTTKFISWAIKSNFSGRPDLAQVYYPSTYNFLWYASRTLFLLENEFQRYDYLVKLDSRDEQDTQFIKRFKSLQSIFVEAKSYLEDAFENAATEFLLKWSINTDPVGAYFCDFLGQNDTDIFGKHVSNNDDCLFSTAQAINILISTWTSQKPNTKRLTWKTSTPQSVHKLVNSSIEWLKTYVLENKYKPLNAFFSGSVKGFSSLPFWYPTNFVQFLNGTIVPNPQNVSQADLDNIVNGVQGSIDEDTYQAELKDLHFGYPTPLEFDGYNVKMNIFPFWSSQPYTYAVSLLALSQFNNIE